MDTIKNEISKGEIKYAQLGLRIDAEMLNLLSEQARIEERSMSQVVRLALRQYLDNYNAQK
jgi:hypothetical protein